MLASDAGNDAELMLRAETQSRCMYEQTLAATTIAEHVAILIILEVLP
jgi:hypothetical protein